MLILSACSMDPSYTRPDLPVAGSYRLNEQDGQQAAAAIAWQQFFLSPEMKTLIAKGLENNRDLREAVLNIQEARAQYRIQRSELLPTIAASGNMSRQKTPETTSPTGQSSITTQYSADIGLSAFELDLFGRVRSLNRSALESYLATEEARGSVQIALVSEIANAYLSLLADSAQQQLADETLKAQQESYDLAKKRFDAGIGTKLDLRQVETLLETARIDQIAYTRQIARDRNALELLVGAPVADEELGGNFADATNTDGAFVSDIQAGLPSALLQNRPDIRAAEHRLKAANANIGAARAAFFPAISLTGSIGMAGTALSDLFSGGAGAWSFVPQIVMPIFTGGRNKANLDLAEIRKEIAIVQYERTIQTAFREVSDALAGRATLDAELQAQTALVAATEDARTIAQARYERGVDNYLAVLDARRTLYSAQQQLIRSQLALLSNSIALYTALGGGDGGVAADSSR